MELSSLTVELQRFGDPTGVIRLSDRYIRTIGTTAPAQEIGFELSQENLDRAMATLDYSRFEYAEDSNAVRTTAEYVLHDLAPYLERFLLGEKPPHFKGTRARKDSCHQLDVVARPLELAQLPFEVLEASNPNLIVTRRIRQPWPMPKVVRDNTPKVLFAWAEPKRSPGSRRRMEVPHERHLQKLKKILGVWGDSAIVEVANANLEELSSKLTDAARYTHVHLLMHGVGAEPRKMAAGERIDLQSSPPPTTCLAFEKADGSIDRVPPKQLASLFTQVDHRPETFAIATCHSAEVDPIRSGSTVAHALHAAGVPIVLGSQLALTKAGSDELIDIFLNKVVQGVDPRRALRATRDKLRELSETTYYDHVALVGYIHIDDGLSQRLLQRRFEVALKRLKQNSSSAERQTSQAITELGQAKAITPEQQQQAEKIRQEFEAVRNGLDRHQHDPALTKAQREELHGLQASALKREAEAAWKLSLVLTGADAETWRDHSRDMLRQAAAAYRRAAEISRDHHWTWVQWLVLEAVQQGNLSDSQADWTTAMVAARDITNRNASNCKTKDERQQLAEQKNWAWGSIIELNLLAPLVGHPSALKQAVGATKALVKAAHRRKDPYPIESTLAQLSRYNDWWGSDDEWKLPKEVVSQAVELTAFLQRLQHEQ
ncbi:MAG: CHAT domain-containing protein [Candidatus Thiodiazotropha sp.]